MKLLVSAGPTREKIDPVRFVSNRSSGKMGYAIAAAGKELGWETTLVSGPPALPPVPGLEFIATESAAEMAEAMQCLFPAADLTVMAAAVADYRPVRSFEQKLKKQPGPLVIEFERTEDILATLGGSKRSDQRLVGFAAESENLLVNAEAKLRRKNLDWIVANSVSAGFGTDTDTVTVLGRNGERIDFESLPKLQLAFRLLELFASGFPGSSR